jgi:hypothetical protein
MSVVGSVKLSVKYNTQVAFTYTRLNVNGGLKDLKPKAIPNLRTFVDG